MGKDFKNRIGNKRLDSLIPPDTQQQEKSSSSLKSEQIQGTQRDVIKKAAPTTVATFRVKTDKLKQLKAVAYWDRKKIQDVLDEALQNYFDQMSGSNLSQAVEAYDNSVK